MKRKINIIDYIKEVENNDTMIDDLNNDTSTINIENDSEINYSTVDAVDFFNKHYNTLSFLSKTINKPTEITKFCESECLNVVEIEKPIISDGPDKSLEHITKINFEEFSNVVGYEWIEYDTSNIFDIRLTLKKTDGSEDLIFGNEIFEKLNELVKIVKENII